MKTGGPSAPSTGAQSSLRLAFVLALTISFAAAASLYQSNIDSDVPPESARGNGAGRGQTRIAQPQAGTPTPLPTPRPRSEAVVSAPDEVGVDLAGGAPPFPSLGRYVYSVQGNERGSFLGGGTRAYPREMTMTVHRPEEFALNSDELVFDIVFSADHREREVVAYRKDGIFFTFESWTVAFGGTIFMNQGSYEPDMLQVPIPLDEGVEHTGSTRVDGSDAGDSRVEEWTVEVLGPDRIFTLGEELDTWMVRIDRTTRAGADEPVTRSRTYWLSPERSIWVRWQETTTTSQGTGLTRSSYTTDYTATLTRIEPL